MKNIQTVVVWGIVIVVALVMMKFIFKIGLLLLVVAGIIYLLMRFGKSSEKI